VHFCTIAQIVYMCRCVFSHRNFGAYILTSQGRYFEAQDAHNRSFQIRVLYLGLSKISQHPEIASSLDALGLSFREQGLFFVIFVCFGAFSNSAICHRQVMWDFGLDLDYMSRT